MSLRAATPPFLAALLVSLTVLTAADAAPLRARACQAPVAFKDRQIALRAISNICGDTWCEGDYSYDFRYLRCCGGVCEVFFFMGNPDNPAKRRYVSCKATGIRNIRDLVKIQKDRNGKAYGELNQRPYEQISKCIETYERQLYRSVFGGR